MQMQLTLDNKPANEADLRQHCPKCGERMETRTFGSGDFESMDYRECPRCRYWEQ